MIKTLFKLLVLALVVLLGYYFFFGSEADKERARGVFAKVGELGREIGSFLSAEKEKFDRGEYDESLQKIDAALDRIGQRAGQRSLADDSEIDRLRAEREALSRAAASDPSDEEARALQQRLEDLERRVQKLASSREGDGRLSDLPPLHERVAE